MANPNPNIICSVQKLKTTAKFNFWQKQMVTHLKACKLHQYIKSALVQDASEDDKAKDSLALSQIHQASDTSVFEKIATADMAKEAWDILEKTYKGIDRVQQNNLMILKSKFKLVTMKKWESIESYFFLFIRY